MATREPIVELISGEVIATGVSEEEYMERYAEHFCEWVDGVVIKMSPVSVLHDHLTFYLRLLLTYYFVHNPIGVIVSAPVLMLIKGNPKREPDIQVILNSNPGKLMPTFMDGPADICIEVVSPGSVDTDHGTKFTEYERGKVGEYWLVDPIRNECRFYRLNDEGVFIRQLEDRNGYYITPRLPHFKLHVPILWQKPLPDADETREAIRAMFISE